MKKVPFTDSFKQYFIGVKGKLVSRYKGKERVLKGTPSHTEGVLDNITVKKRGLIQISRARILYATYNNKTLKQLDGKQVVRKDGDKFKVGHSWKSLTLKTPSKAAANVYRFKKLKNKKRK